MLAARIKELLGEELAKQVEEKLKGQGKDGKDIDAVIGNDGSFVPADKYDTLKSEKAAADKLATDTANQLKQLKDAGDPEKLKADLAAAQAKLTDLEKGHAAEVAKIRKSNLVTLKVINEAYDPADVVSALDLDKIVLNDKGEITGGLDDQLKDVKARKPHWFKAAEDGPTGGIPPNQGGKPAVSVNPWKKESFNLTEQGRILRDSPDLAAKLMSQAGCCCYHPACQGVGRYWSVRRSGRQ